MVEAHGDDVQRLPSTLRAARAVRVFAAGCLHYDPPGLDRILSEEPVLVLNELQQVAVLAQLLTIESVMDGMCMCAGDATLEFLDGDGRRLAAVGLHHGRRVRWSGWSGDAELKDGSALLQWLASYGVAGPLEDKTRAAVQRDVALAQQEAWKDRVPACVRPLADEMVAAGPQDRGVADEVSAQMRVAYPDDVQRCRALLVWFSAGTAANTGYPTYEDFPGTIVKSMPINVVLAALDGEPEGSPVWAGGLRHIAGWKSRADHEIRQVRAAVWDRLLELARAAGDADKRQRIERKHAEFRPPA
ncbi:hypothetical protein [Cellulomonas sp. URHB0016]